MPHHAAQLVPPSKSNDIQADPTLMAAFDHEAMSLPQPQSGRGARGESVGASAATVEVMPSNDVAPVRSLPKPVSGPKVSAAKRPLVIIVPDHEMFHHGLAQIIKSTEVFVRQHVSASDAYFTRHRHHRARRVKVRALQSEDFKSDKTHRGRK